MTSKELVFERLKQVAGFTNFNDEVTNKKNIVLHHTAGGTAMSSINYWKQNQNKVSTFVVVDRDGTIYQCFPSDRWAFSLGLNVSNFREIEKQTIAIEIANYGYLIKSRGDYYNAYQGYISPDNVCVLNSPFKGIVAFEKYTEAQIESTRRLILYLSEKFNIDISNKENIFDLNSNALKGIGGLWSHNSFRKDKTDIYPQPEMIEMLKGL